MQFRYRLSKFSLIGVVIVVLGVTMMLVHYSQYHAYASKILNAPAKAQPKLGKSFNDMPALGTDEKVQEKKIEKAKSTFRWGVGTGLLVVIVGSVVMAWPAKNYQLPEKKAKPKGASKAGTKASPRRRAEPVEEEDE